MTFLRRMLGVDQEIKALETLVEAKHLTNMGMRKRIEELEEINSKLATVNRDLRVELAGLKRKLK